MTRFSSFVIRHLVISTWTLPLLRLLPLLPLSLGLPEVTADHDDRVVSFCRGRAMRRGLGVSLLVAGLFAAAVWTIGLTVGWDKLAPTRAVGQNRFDGERGPTAVLG